MCKKQKNAKWSRPHLNQKIFSSDAPEESLFPSLTFLSFTPPHPTPLIPPFPSRYSFPLTFNSSLPSAEACCRAGMDDLTRTSCDVVDAILHYSVISPKDNNRRNNDFRSPLVSLKVTIRGVWHNSINGYSLCYTYTLNNCKVTAGNGNQTAMHCSLCKIHN